jgi:small-conductance mechanosensitive channel
MTHWDMAVTWWSAPLFHIVGIGLAGIIVWSVIPGRFANTRLIVQIGFFLAMSAMLLAQHIVPYEPIAGDDTVAMTMLVGLVQLLWWLHLAWALIGFVRIFLVLEGNPREARILQDLAVGIVYAGMLLSILAFVFGAPVGTLIATSGVFAIVFGLALQNTLGDLFSGIALSLGHPFAVGDWIVLGDGTEGRVIETNWRSTYLHTLANNIVALPNSSLSKLGLTNFSRPDESHGQAVKIRLAPTRMPSVTVEVMRTVLASCNTIVKEPPPTVAIRNLDASAIELDLFFRVAHVADRIAARNEVIDLAYRHAKSNGLLLAAPPTSSILLDGLPTEETAKPPSVTPVELIRAIPIFSALTDDEREALAATTSVRTYRKGEIIAKKGEMLPALMIIRSGIVVRESDNDEAEPQEIGRLSPGSFFGETGLLVGQGEMSTLRAKTHVVVYQIDQERFALLLSDRPEMAEDLTATLSNGMPTFGESNSVQSSGNSKPALLKAMRTIFHGTAHNRI